MELHQKQSEFIQSNKRYKLLNWGRRSGKTFAVGYEAFITAYSKDKARIAYYAPTSEDARDIAWGDFVDLFEPITIKTNEVLLEITVKNKFGGTSLIKLYGWEAVKNRDKGRGVENDLVILDECAFYPMFKEKFEKVIEPTLLTSLGRLIVTSTPNGFNHFYELVTEAQSDDDWYYSHATSYDNPHNPIEELEKLKAKKGEDAFAQEYLADFRRLEGLVYKDFDFNRHVVDELPQEHLIVDRIGFIDFGYKNPAAIGTVLVDKDSNYYITDEYYQTDKVQDELNQEMLSRKLNSWYPDPAEPDRIEMMRRAGLRTKEVSKDVKSGIGTVSQLFRENRLFIHNGCKNLIFELNSYRWRQSTNSNINLNEPEEPIKENDHMLDGSRYVLHNYENVRKPNHDLDNYYREARNNSSYRAGVV
ncbi:terminase large subunit [Paracoccaceae bacterium GXU_MW_L88]